MAQSAASHGALAGIRVIDLSRVLAGPLCTMMLGDMGAEIIKIEPPGSGDDTRRWGPPFVAGESAYFLGVNRNKQSLTLNLAREDGRSILAALIGKADVVINNYKVGTFEKWGFNDAWFDAKAPRVVRCSITGYGSSGPKAALPGYDFILQAESGLMSICGDVDGEPTKYGVAIVDVCTGMLACNAVLAALNARHTTNKGQKVEVSLYETSLAMLANVASSYLISGKDAGRYGNGHPSIVPYTTYKAADQMFAVAVGNDGQFRKFAECLGHPEWADDPRFAANSGRVGSRAVLDALIRDVVVLEPAGVWLQRLKTAGIPCGMINTVAQALDDPHTQAREMIETFGHPTAGQIKMLGIPMKFSATPSAVRSAPPTLGQHTDDILRDVLGFDLAHIANLRAERDGMSIGKSLSHVSIAVPDLDAAIRTMRDIYGLDCGAIAENVQQGVRLAYVDLGNSKIELMQPLRADSPVGRFLSKNPNGGLHHICLGVDQVAAETAALAQSGIRIVGGGTPTYNVHKQAIAFIHPSDFFGALLELEQRAEGEPHGK